MTTHTSKFIEIYVCPTPDCGNYYGQPNMPDLTKEFQGPKVEDKDRLERSSGSQARIARADCPDCAQRGLGRVTRVRMKIPVTVPVKGPDPQPLPASSGQLH